MGNQSIDTDRIDDAVLALMALTLHDFDKVSDTVRAWKSFDWDVLGRLHERGDILDPVGKTKSVRLTPEGRRRCEALFVRLFTRPSPDPDPR